MTPEKWQGIIGQIKDNFSIEEHDSYSLEDYGGREVEYIIFSSPIGKTKLEFISQPILLEKKTNYSRRPGSEVEVEKIYSQEEKSYTMKIYKWNQELDDWIKVDPEKFQL